MTPDEIRKMRVGSRPDSVDRVSALFLQEIAAQLAEMMMILKKWAGE